jgi:RNA polymerase sigma factor (sigma-70 family)
LSPLLSIRFLQTQPDARLVALARAGNERAFEALVRRYRRQLLSYCQRIGSPTANAEDALQQTFLHAWVALTAGREVRDVRAWLYRIAHNVVISSVRQPAGAATQVDVQAAARGADDEAEQRLAVRDALAGLASLPGLQRDVMVGAAVDGLTHAEIARELGLTSGAVRGLIYRARSALRLVAGVIVPAPVLHWAARQGAAPGSGSRLYEAVARGGGSAGVGGLLLKSGVITATAGVLATAAGVVSHHHPPHRARPAVQVVATSGGRVRRAPVVAHPGATPSAIVVESAAVTRSQRQPPAAQARIILPSAPRSVARPLRSVQEPRPGRAYQAPTQDHRPAGGDRAHSGGDDRGDHGATAPPIASTPTFHDGSSTTDDGSGSDGQLSATTDQQHQDGSGDSTSSDGGGSGVSTGPSSTTYTQPPRGGD